MTWLSFAQTHCFAHTPAAQDAIAEWLDGLLSGKVRTAPLARLPAFLAADEAAEGAGGVEVAVEDEFDLSEIMGVSL
jgi:hypothetical protein